MGDHRPRGIISSAAIAPAICGRPDARPASEMARALCQSPRGLCGAPWRPDARTLSRNSTNRLTLLPAFQMVGLAGEMPAQGPLGRYRKVLLLGQGGTADVHLAVAEGPGGFRKLVVLKVLKPALSHDPELRGMFLNEARLAARLHHPNVVQTYEVLDDDGGPVIVMEYLDGQPLSNLIVQGRGAGLTLGAQVRVLVDALAGLHAAHELR